MQLVQDWWIPSTVLEPRHPVLSRQKHTRVIRDALKLDARRGTCLQAGGHLGLWPKILAEHYQRVITVEAYPENWACLVRNVAAIPGIEVIHGALGERLGTVAMQQRPRSTGGHYLKRAPVGNIPMMTIDSLALPHLDALFLDIEGYERAALEGGAVTIARDRPLIVCEINAACERYGWQPQDIVTYLAQWSYAIVHQYRQDIVFVATKG